jgi:hypothetical protein
MNAAQEQVDTAGAAALQTTPRLTSTDQRPLDAGDWTDIIVAIAVAVMLYSGLIWCALRYSGAISGPLLVLSGLLGASLGWVIGILFSPYDPKEQSAFGELAKLIYGFLSGYVLSKFDPVLTTALRDGLL